MLIVQKYGGTSIGSVERLNAVANNIKRFTEEGHSLLVVVSAMGKQTDELVELAYQLSPSPSRREMDVLLSCGEQTSMALLSMALHHRHIAAHSYSGWQVPIHTDDFHTKARITQIETRRIKKDIANRYVVVVAGFQGVNDKQEVTTLGRGGSDTTAVALAVRFGADECQIYTDVDGIYTTDPRIEPKARMLSKITLEEMVELAGLGSQVLQTRAVRLAGKHNVPLRVLSSFKNNGSNDGTLVVKKGDEEMEETVVSGIAHNRDEAKITITDVPDRPGIAAQILEKIGEDKIEVDMIVQNVSTNNTADFTFTVHRRDYKRAKQLIQELISELGTAKVNGDNTIVKVSVVGLGMRSHSGVAAKMFHALARENINIQIISTSEIRISIIIEERYLELAVRCLHKEFGLDKRPSQKRKSRAKAK